MYDYALKWVDFMTKKIKLLSIFACVMAFLMLFPVSTFATEKQGYDTALTAAKGSGYAPEHHRCR